MGWDIQQCRDFDDLQQADVRLARLQALQPPRVYWNALGELLLREPLCKALLTNAQPELHNDVARRRFSHRGDKRTPNDPLTRRPTPRFAVMNYPTTDRVWCCRSACGFYLSQGGIDPCSPALPHLLPRSK